MANSLPPEATRKVVKIKRFQISVNVLIQTGVFLVIVAMVNYMSFRHFKRWDFSRNRKYELSSQTKNVLKNMKKPVRAIIFFSSATEIIPDVNGLLREYEFASNKKFKTEVVDPYRNLSRAQELQTKYRFGTNENILILDIDGKSKFVNAGDMVITEEPDQMQVMLGQTQPRITGFKGEQAVTSAMMELIDGKPNKVYFVGGHGEPNLESPDLKFFNESLKRQNIQISPLLLLNQNNIPEDCRAPHHLRSETRFLRIRIETARRFLGQKRPGVHPAQSFCRHPAALQLHGEPGDRSPAGSRHQAGQFPPV